MFEIHSGLIFWTALSFFIMLYLLYKLVFPPLMKVLDERKTAIEGGLEKARQAQQDAEALLKKYEDQLAEAEKKTSQMFDDAERRSQTIRDEAIKEAQKESFRVIEATRKDIELYKRKALEDLKGNITQLVLDLSGRLIKKTLKFEDHQKLIEASISELEKNEKGKI